MDWYSFWFGFATVMVLELLCLIFDKWFWGWGE